MKTIRDWLEDRLESMNREGFEIDASAFDQQADLLRAEAQADGYEVSDLDELCNGDIAAYLRDRREAISSASLAGRITPDD